MSPLSEEGTNWYSLSTILSWVNERSMSKKGLLAVSAACALVALLIGSSTGKLYFFFVFPVLILLYFFISFLLSFAAMAGDLIASHVFKKIFKNPNPNSSFQKVLYFILSLAGLLIGALVIGLGNESAYLYR